MSSFTFIAPPPSGPVEPGPTPTFSVLIPAYQAAATIGDALESVFAQTVPPREVIVCDDGSTDDLEASLAPFRARIVFISKANGGGASALNAAAQRAGGTFVATLDADDAYLPERLEALGALAAARPDLDVLATDAFFEVDERLTGRFNASNRFPVDDQRQAVLERCFVFAAAVRRTALAAAGGYDESLPVAYDWDLLMRLVLGGAAVGLVAEPLIAYRLHEGSLAADRIRSLRDRVAVLEKNAEGACARPADRDAYHRALRLHRDRADASEAELASWERGPGARRRAVSVAAARSLPLRVRAWGLAAALAPPLGRRLLARRDRRRARSVLPSRREHGDLGLTPE